MDDRGIPTVVLVTEPFIPTAQEIARIRELPDYRFAVLAHPLGSLDEAQTRERAQDAATQAVEILTG